MEAPEVKAAVGAALRARRVELGLSQDALAARAGINRTYISSAERGLRNLSLVNLVRLARALDIPAAGLLERAGL
ncbi:MAG TPA: helix-turn-helix transcriptional regulator [Solirubrobacteraceae bacterium]|jgi:transcriptional regulator with XRE-family HTH domain